MKLSRRCYFRRKMRWACLIRPVIGYLVCLSVFTLLYAPRLRKQAFWRHYSPQWDNWAIALKSGHQVAFDRVPIVLETYLGSVRNMMLIGETSNVTINGARMVGVDVTLASLQNTKEQSHGWEFDAHKNLPAFRLLYERFPDAEWYIMIDDDTYLFKSNLHLMLSEYNSSLPYYMGKVKLFGGCGGFQFSTSPLFVHGGAGIILSRGALLQMLPILDTCISKYRDCHFGDVKTGLCLLDAGVKARAMDGFNDEMRGLNEGLEHACLPPITYHHLTPALITRLWNLEMQKALTEKTHVLTADIYSTIIKMPLDDAMHAEQDLQGMDFSDYPSKGALECQASCLEKPECTAFTDDGRWCWLKTGGVPRPISKLGCTSGMISSHFVCHESPKPLSFLTDISFL